MPEGVDDDNTPLEHIKEEEDDNNKGEEEEEGKDDEDDNIDELEELSESERLRLLVDTTVVHETVTKVSCNESKHVCLLNIY